jgi:hypothetical protein
MAGRGERCGSGKYRRVFAGYLSKVESKTLRTLAVAPNALCREASAIVNAEFGPVTCRTITVIAFDGDFVSGERSYTDLYTAEMFRRALGTDFGAVPGVWKFS